MPRNNIFEWPDGAGWLVLSGGADPESDIRAQVLTRLQADGPAVYLALSNGTDAAEAALDDMEDLGAPSGYLVDAAAEDDATLTEKLGEASLIVIEALPTGDDARSALVGAAIDGIEAAYQNGAVILAEGQSAMVFGAWVVLKHNGLKDGFEWLPSALIGPGVTSAAVWARELLLTQPAAFAIGIGEGSALALGPEGQIELLGRGEVTVALGQLFAGPTGQQKE